MKRRSGYLFKRGSNFYCAWRVNGKLFTRALRDENGQPITGKREAEIARDRFMLPIATGDEAAVLESIAGRLEGRKAELAKWEDEKNPPLPVSRAWVEYLDSTNRPDSGESTLRQYEFQFSAFAKWVKEKHGETATLPEITKDIAEEYAGQLNHGRFSPSTYNKHLNLLTLVFRVLKHKAKLTANPWEEIQRKRVVSQSRRELTIDELKKVCLAAQGELRTLFALGLYSGLRLGDCATLRWGEVDLSQGIIRRIPNKTARRNPKPVIIPVHPALREMLSTSPIEQRGEYVLPDIAATYARRSDMVTDMVQKHFKSCDIHLHKPGTGTEGKRAVIEVGFHSLRHTFVSMCRASDVPLSVVESLVGHSTPSMTKFYTHTGQLAAGRAIALLPAVMGNANDNAVQSEPDSILLKAQKLAKSITAANWKTKKAALLALLA